LKRPPATARAVHRLRLARGLDRHAVEALWLELRRLAREHGLEIEVRVERTAVRRTA